MEVLIVQRLQCHCKCPMNIYAFMSSTGWFQALQLRELKEENELQVVHPSTLAPCRFFSASPGQNKDFI